MSRRGDERWARWADRLTPEFSTRDRGAQSVAVLVVSPAFGALTGLALGWSAGLWWALQVVGLVGGYLAGTEHRGGWAGADRGLVGGVLFGSFVLLANAVSGLDAKAALPEPAGAFVVFAGLVGAGLGALGGAARARIERAAAAQVTERP